MQTYLQGLSVQIKSLMAQSSVAVKLRTVIGISCSLGDRNIDLPNQSREVLLCRSLLHIIIACNGTTGAALLRHWCPTDAPLDNCMKAMARGEGGDQLRSASFGEGVRVSLLAKGFSKLSVPSSRFRVYSRLWEVLFASRYKDSELHCCGVSCSAPTATILRISGKRSLLRLSDPFTRSSGLRVWLQTFAVLCDTLPERDPFND